MNGEPNNSFGAGGPPSTNGNSVYGFNHSLPRPGRKRGWHLSTQGTPPDQVDGAYNVKLYIAPVPRTSTENDIRLVFEEHGTIVEVVLLRDKKTGERQGSCFVKFATLDEAEKAIKALSNQYTFPGELSPIVVRFADREKERLGIRGFSQNMDKKNPSEGIRGFSQIMDRKNSSEEVVDKVFVGGINKESTKKEIEEVFSPFGHVEDIFIAQSRGYCFVKFSNKDMALAAIKGLNNAFTMRGCDHPLIVRFAEPKKPKTGEPRVNHMPGSSFGPCSQEPGVWFPQNFGDSIGGSNLPMAPHHPTVPHPQVAPHIQNWEPANAMVQQPFPSQQPHPQLAPMPSQPMQTQKLSSQPVVTEVQKQSHPTDSSTQNIEQPLNSQPSQTGSSPCAVAGSTSPDMPECSDEEIFPDCDWSEHICPDGNKYYYKITCLLKVGGRSLRNMPCMRKNYKRRIRAVQIHSWHYLPDKLLKYTRKQVVVASRLFFVLTRIQNVKSQLLLEGFLVSEGFELPNSGLRLHAYNKRLADFLFCFIFSLIREVYRMQLGTCYNIMFLDAHTCTHELKMVITYIERMREVFWVASGATSLLLEQNSIRCMTMVCYLKNPKGFVSTWKLQLLLVGEKGIENPCQGKLGSGFSYNSFFYFFSQNISVCGIFYMVKFLSFIS